MQFLFRSAPQNIFNLFKLFHTFYCSYCLNLITLQSTRWLLYVEQAPSAWFNFALCGLIGIITAYIFVWITKYYTDYKHEPVRTLALSSSTGHGTNIIAGVSLGLESTGLPVLVISVAIVSAYWLGQTAGLIDETGNPTGGLFGTAVATMGMLSTAAYILTMDMFGPIADNAGGIVEMSQQVVLARTNIFHTVLLYLRFLMVRILTLPIISLKVSERSLMSLMPWATQPKPPPKDLPLVLLRLPLSFCLVLTWMRFLHFLANLLNRSAELAPILLGY